MGGWVEVVVAGGAGECAGVQERRNMGRGHKMPAMNQTNGTGTLNRFRFVKKSKSELFALAFCTFFVRLTVSLGTVLLVCPPTLNRG